MSWHVVGALVRVAPPAGGWREVIRPGHEVVLHGGVCVLLNHETRGGVPDKDNAQADVKASVRNDLLNTGRDVGQCMRFGGDGENFLNVCHGANLVRHIVQKQSGCSKNDQKLAPCPRTPYPETRQNNGEGFDLTQMPTGGPKTMSMEQERRVGPARMSVSTIVDIGAGADGSASFEAEAVDVTTGGMRLNTA